MWTSTSAFPMGFHGLSRTSSLTFKTFLYFCLILTTTLLKELAAYRYSCNRIYHKLCLHQLSELYDQLTAQFCDDDVSFSSRTAGAAADGMAWKQRVNCCKDICGMRSTAGRKTWPLGSVALWMDYLTIPVHNIKDQRSSVFSRRIFIIWLIRWQRLKLFV